MEILDPPTFMTRDPSGTLRAYNDRSKRCKLSDADPDLPVIDINPEVPQAVHAAKANEVEKNRRLAEAMSKAKGLT